MAEQTGTEAAEFAPQTHPNASGSTEQRCAQCGSPFEARKAWQVFCSRTCRSRFHNTDNSQKGMAKRIAALEDEVKDLREQVAMVRGHLVL